MSSLIIVAVILGLIVITGLIVIGIYNSLIRLRNKVDEAWSGIDVQLKRRHDLVPNLVNTVKGYAEHERGTLEAVVAARNSAVQANDPKEAGAAEGMLSQMLGKVFALAEAYPDLKANDNFLELQRQLSEIEDELSASRRIYNGNVQLYNTKIQVVPNVFIARPFGFSEREFFEIEDPSEREVVNVSF